MSRSRSEKLGLMWKWSAVGLTILVILMIFFKEREPLKKAEMAAPPLVETKTDRDTVFSPEALVSAGEFIIFGTDQPTLNSTGRLPLGKGKCAFCHLFVSEQKTDRCPSLIGIEKKSHSRPKEGRYADSLKKYTDQPEPESGVKPRARTGGEYLIESLYCPNCYVVEGYGRKGSDDLESEMPIMTQMPFELSDFEIVAIVAYLQAKDTPGDYSRVTAREDWEHYFKKTLLPPSKKTFDPLLKEVQSKTALMTDTPEEMIEKMGCFVCHKIPSVPVAKTGVIGPLLTLKTDATTRLNSPEYQKALQEGRVHARTPAEYVKESILNPGVFLSPGFRDGMPTHYEKKFTMGALDKLVAFLLTIDAEMATEMLEEEPLVLPDETRSGRSKRD
ncbi:MAG: hypothetical protein ACE5FY_06250 [Nitrospiria bacterium]